MAIYKAKGIADRTPVSPDLSVMQSFDAKRRQGLGQIDKMAEGYGKQQQIIDVETEKQQKQAEANLAKQRKIYNTAQVNLGNSSIREASITYKDNIVKFDESVKNAIDEISKGLQSDEEIIEFRSRISLQLKPTRAQIQVNYNNKVNKREKEGIQKEAQLILANSLSNIGLVTGDNGSDILVNLSQLSGMAKEKDQYGNNMLSDKQIAKINDLKDNQQYYTMLAVAEEASAAGNEKKLETEHNRLLDNKESVMRENNLSQDQYTDLLEATKPSQTYLSQKEKDQLPSPVIKAQAKAGIEAGIKSLNLKSKDARGSMLEVMQSIEEIESAYKNKLVDAKYYSKNIVELKSTYYNMQKEANLFSKKTVSGKIPFTKKEVPTVGTNLVEAVERVTEGLTERGSILDSRKYDMSSAYYNAIVKAGVDPDAVDDTNIAKANTIIRQETPKIMKSLYESANLFTDEQLMQPETRKIVMTTAWNQKISADMAKRIGVSNDKINSMLNEWGI